MRRRDLTELANNPDLISGIYNYCDRWCERCPLTSRCLVYAAEQEDGGASQENQDMRNEAFWRKLGSILLETRELVAGWAKQASVDLTEPTGETESRYQRKRQLVDNHPLAKYGKKYANAASEWFREFDHTTDRAES